MKGRGSHSPSLESPSFPSAFYCQCLDKAGPFLRGELPELGCSNVQGWGRKKPLKKQTLDLPMVSFWSPDKKCPRIYFFHGSISVEFFLLLFFFFKTELLTPFCQKKCNSCLLRCFQRPFPEVLTPTREPLPEPGPDSG